MNTEKNTYKKLSEEAREKLKQSATAYNREKATRITLKVKKENFADIEKYMNLAIADGKAKSKNDFIIQCLRRCVDDDIFSVND